MYIVIMINMATFKVISFFLCVLVVEVELHPMLAYPEYSRRSDFERIIQGLPAGAGQFPYQVHLIMTKSTGGNAACGGALISKTHVLTAAHCLQDKVSVNVRMGTNSLSSGTVMTSKTFIIHPNYTSPAVRADIGIITLPSSIVESSTIKTIRLPKLSESSVTHTGKVATVSGWGYTANTAPISQTLNYVKLSVITNQKCIDTYGSAVTSYTICCVGIQNPAQSTCSGDSGGPLTITDADGIVTHIGVVRFVSSLGCDSGKPSGYTRTGPFLTWISNKTGITIRP